MINIFDIIASKLIKEKKEKNNKNKN